MTPRTRQRLRAWAFPGAGFVAALTILLLYALTQTFVWLHYVRIFFLPVGLTADADMALVSTWYDTRIAAGVLCIAVLLQQGLRRKRVAYSGLLPFCLPTPAF